MRRLSREDARMIALGAQGFAKPRPTGRIDVRHFRRLFETVGLLQLDSVNVFSRSHYLPALARLGGYDRAALDEYGSRSGEIWEYWGHEASLLPVELYPLFRHRMEAIKPWGRIRALEEEHPGYIEEVFREVAEFGPVSVSELAEPGVRTGPWWGYGRGKIALEWLFAKGRVASYRTPAFGRMYALPEQILPKDVLDASPASRDVAYRDLLVHAARHHGVGTATDLADYFRLHLPTARPILAELAVEGRIQEVEVDGWRGPVYMHPQARRPRAVQGAALLSPFDSLVWHRDRTERVFGFHYRIEIYVPQPKRIYGYYVLPFLLNGHLVGRVDLKADRRHRVLQVRSAFIEPGYASTDVAPALAAELNRAAVWSGLEDVHVSSHGNLATQLRAAVKRGA